MQVVIHQLALMGSDDASHGTHRLCSAIIALVLYVGMSTSPIAPVERSIQHFSTEAVPPQLRLDYWRNLLTQSVWPVSEWSGVSDFNFELRETPLGGLTATRQSVSPHWSRRTLKDVDNSRERKFLLFSGSIPWDIAHNGYNEHVLAGDCLLVDSQGEHEISCPDGFSGVVLRLPVDWLLTWIPDADSLVGRRISGDSRWGRVLSPIVGQLTPEFAADAPLPHGVLVDQLGVSLTLLNNDSEFNSKPDLLRRILDCIRDRCKDSELTAADVAATLGISSRLIHRTLSAKRLTFASQLITARIKVAEGILNSPFAKGLTITEVSRQAGFLSPAHFRRVMQKRSGFSPHELEPSTKRSTLR